MAQAQRCEVDAMQVRVGTVWTDTQGTEFVVDAVANNEAQTWIAYYRVDTNTHYRCLYEAFVYRFRELKQ